jgi:hypothetical protein
MSDRQSLIEQQYIPAGDGWDDAAAEAGERTIRGQLLKFADWRWTIGKEATPVESGTRLVALATAAMWVRWEDGKPVEHIVRRPGERLPEREKLGFTDEKEWEKDPGGERKDPWANTRLVYLVDPDSAEAFTFSTSSWGGRAAVIELGDQIARMRATHPTQRRSSNCARWRCLRGTAASPSRRSRLSAGRTPTSDPPKSPRLRQTLSRSSGSGRLSRPAVRRWLVLSRRRPRRPSKSKTGRGRSTIPSLEK